MSEWISHGVDKSLTVTDKISSSTREQQVSGADVHPENMLKTFI
jgi:hypothetical protein